VGTLSRTNSAVRIFAGISIAGFLFALAAPGRLAASGYEFDGIGAQAVARGGAVVADVNDWTAIYWNPAGLADVKTREAGLELRAGKMYTKDGNSFNIPLGNGVTVNPFDKTRVTSGFVLGSLGTVVPLDDKSAIAAGAYTPLLQGSDFSDTSPASQIATSLDYKGNVVIGVANVSYARKLTDRLSAGVGVNAIDASFNAKSEIGWSALLESNFPLISFLAGSTQRSKSDASGFGVEGEAGVTYKINDRWKAGAVVRSGSKIILRGDETITFNTPIPTEKSDFTLPVYMPPTSSFGAAWQAGKDLKLTCDISQTWWKGFSNAMTYSDQGVLLQDVHDTYHWKDSWKFRLGMLARLSGRTNVMAGYAFDTPAIDSHSIDFSTGVDVPMHRVSAAVSHNWASIEGTLGALAGVGRRTAAGVNYSLGGWFVMSEGKYRF
jgi:long-chain fatty acid transport protein